MSELSDRLTQIRKEKELLLKQIASRTDLSIGYLSQIFSGERPPTRKTLGKICSSLDMDEALHTEFLKALEREELSAGGDGKQIRASLAESYAGILRVQKTLPNQLIAARFQEAKQRIYIQDIWLGDVPFYSRLLRHALKQNANLEVKILLLTPESNLVNFRQFDLDLEDNYIRSQLESFIRACIRIYDTVIPKNFEVRIFDSIPSVSQIIIDDTAFVGFYLHGYRSNEAPQLEITLNNESGNYLYLGTVFVEEFEHLWNHPLTKNAIR